MGIDLAKTKQGKPCKHCGGTLLWRGNSNCVACQRAGTRERQRRRYHTDPEYRRLAIQREVNRYASDPVYREAKKARERERSRNRPSTPESRQRARASRIRKKYGLTPDDYDALLLEQGGGCAICAIDSQQLAVDHDHETGAVRGLLCHPCNLSIGFVDDDPERLRAAAQYLESHRSAT